MKKLFSIALVLGLALAEASAVYLQPFWYYGRDQFGLPVTNAITIDAWPPTNSITANSSNLVFSVAHTFIPDANGFVSNNVALGNYRVVIQGFSAGVPFSILSNNLPVNISMTANVPVTTFQNFTMAQIIDAGSIATRSSNDFALASSIGTIAGRASNDFALASSLGTIAGRASNDFALASSLGTIAGRASNDFALASSLGTIAGRASNDFALATSLGSIAGRGSNDFHLADGRVGLSALAGIANIVTNGGGIWVWYQTNGVPGSAFTNLGNGALMTTTNGGFYSLSNLVWQPK